MSSAQDAALGVLRLMADFVKSLRPDEVEDLLTKRSRLALLPPGAIVAKPGIEATGLNLLTGILKKLSPDQIEGIREKRGELVYLPPGAAIAYPAVTDDEIIAQLSKFAGRNEATKYLTALKLKATDFKRLAKALDVALDSRDKVGDMREKIVEATVGTRVDSALIRGGAWSRS